MYNCFEIMFLEIIMKQKSKRIPVNSVGKLIKEAREKQNLTVQELVWKINNIKITEKRIKNWEKGQEFPDLDEIYILSEHLNLNPNELLGKRLTIQDESIHEVNESSKRIGEKIFSVFYVIVKYTVKYLAGICIIILAANYKKFENKIGGTSDPEQENLIVQVIDNGIEQFTTFDLSGKNNVQKNDSNENTNIDNTVNTISNEVE
jgi:transcriptional regulator with XRE-family HTH domain